MPSNTTREYIQSLKASQRLGDQVAAHKLFGVQTAAQSPLPEDISPALRRILSALGITELYSHQHEAIAAVRKGRHVVVATPTASGKSMIYNLPLFDAVAKDADTRALYVFPLKALTRDQLNILQQWSAVDPDLSPTAAVYDGDTRAYRRRKIRQNPPHVVLTNPEMVHLSLLAFHAKWRTFFEHLQLVVVDEIHTYRGLLGNHMAQVLRRLRRICRLYGADPTFVFASATIANPEQLAKQLTGLEVISIKESGAPVGRRHMVLMDPMQGPARTAILLLKAAMARRLRTILYTQSRKMAELITIWVQQQAGAMADRISVYRAGLTAKQRRQIEHDLKAGRLLAVVSTSALELGIDIGDLDICVLAGYPGSMIAVQQRGGRVGRKGQESALIMLAGQDAMDQYYIANSEAFFSGRAESAVINPLNPVVLEAHLICAAAEAPLLLDEPWLLEAGMPEIVEALVRNGGLLQSEDGQTLHTRWKRPHRRVNLRSAGRRFRIMCKGEPIGEINGFRLYRETHPGAVYLHQGKTYLIEAVDESDRVVQASEAELNYHTRVRSDSDVVILEKESETYLGKTNICIGKVKVIDQVVSYVRVDNRNGRKLDDVRLNVPASKFITDALWFELSSEICRRCIQQRHDLLGALHATEHAAIGVMPLLVLADRNDLGGLATPVHPQTKKATIFIYDGIPGGAGLSRQAFRQSQELLETAGDAIQRCRCDSGCPACIQSSKCGSGNHPLDKEGALFILRQMFHPGRPAAKGQSRLLDLNEPAPNMKPAASRSSIRYGVFDLETQHSAEEVGGWHMAHAMRVSCGVVYDSLDDTFAVYMEDQVPQLINHIEQLELVVGFNIKRFDYSVLSAYSNVDFNSLNNFDLLEEVYRTLGFRLSLDHLAENTLQMQKTGSGLDALKWWRQGRMDQLIDYCQHDVQITRDLYRFARDKGYLIYRDKDGNRFRVPLSGMVSER